MSKCCALAFHQMSAIVSDVGESELLQSFELNNALGQCVSQNGLRGKKTVGVLSPLDYQLLRVARPNVPAREMLSAILWKEQARFSLPIDQLVIDYVESPSASNEKRIYVVAVAKRALKDRFQTLIDVHLRPIKLSVCEFIYAQYVSQNYSSESALIWVNYFQDAPQVFAFYQGELVATLKLPKIETAVMSEACMTALNLFYLAEIKPFSSSPLWLMNGVFTIEESILSQINGRVEWLGVEQGSHYRKALERYNHSAVSHAYYGMLAHE
ncbi:MAG: hypothetical protein KBD83_02105 [Gammaproteobacteria bacterium]|nr:hypothetical protein [Gammaproteobacteria bacterium]